jgi:hypothetical protein
VPSLTTNFKPYGITFHMNGQPTILDRKKACNKCRNLKNWNSGTDNMYQFKFVIICISVHRNLFKGWLGKKSLFEGRIFSEKDPSSSTGWCFHLLHGNIHRKIDKVLYSLTIWQQDGAKPHQANMVMDRLESIFEERMLIMGQEGWQLSPLFPRYEPLWQPHVVWPEGGFLQATDL